MFVCFEAVRVANKNVRAKNIKYAYPSKLNLNIQSGPLALANHLNMQSIGAALSRRGGG